jgi:hypothetical protein
MHARFDGPLVMIGFGSIGRGVLPLILRHIAVDRAQMTVIEPSGEFAHILGGICGGLFGFSGLVVKKKQKTEFDFY